MSGPQRTAPVSVILGAIGSVRSAIFPALAIAFSGIGGSSIEAIVARIHPFVIVSTISIFLIAFFPQISLWLPKMVGY